MITDKPFPLGVIWDIYWPWFALWAPLAPSRLRVCYGLWTGRYEADRRKVPIWSFTSSWLTGCSAGCAAQEPCLWSGGLCIMEQSIYMANTHTCTHTHELYSFPRQEVQAIYTSTKDTVLPCLRFWSGTHIVLLSVGLCLCWRVLKVSTECRHMQAWAKIYNLFRLLIPVQAC